MGRQLTPPAVGEGKRRAVEALLLSRQKPLPVATKIELGARCTSMCICVWHPKSERACLCLLGGGEHSPRAAYLYTEHSGHLGGGSSDQTKWHKAKNYLFHASKHPHLFSFKSLCVFLLLFFMAGSTLPSDAAGTGGKTSQVAQRREGLPLLRLVCLPLPR